MVPLAKTDVDPFADHVVEIGKRWEGLREWALLNR